jgi:glyceraldehyde 3-phosphate dehydrogenase
VESDVSPSGLDRGLGIGDARASVVDLGMTMVVDGDLVKVMSWYDNEWGYASQMVREALRLVGEA